MIKKRIFYFAGHQGFINKFMVHRLRNNSENTAFLFYGNKDLIGPLFDKMDSLVSSGIFDYVIHANDSVGYQSKSDDECITKILGYYDKILKENGIFINNSDEVYVGVDTLNSYGIYLSLKNIEFYYYENTPGFFNYSQERLHKSINDGVSKSYTNLMDRLSISDASANNITRIVSSLELYKDSKLKYITFDMSKEILNLDVKDRKKLLSIFGYGEFKLPENTAIIATASEWALRKFPEDERKSVFMAMYRSIINYCIPENKEILIKPHPLSKISENDIQSELMRFTFEKTFPSEFIVLLDGVQKLTIYTTTSSGIHIEGSQTVYLGEKYNTLYEFVPILDCVMDLSRYLDKRCVIPSFYIDTIYKIFSKYDESIDSVSQKDESSLLIMFDDKSFRDIRKKHNYKSSAMTYCLLYSEYPHLSIIFDACIINDKNLYKVQLTCDEKSIFDYHDYFWIITDNPFFEKEYKYRFIQKTNGIIIESKIFKDSEYKGIDLSDIDTEILTEIIHNNKHKNDIDSKINWISERTGIKYN